MSTEAIAFAGVGVALLAVLVPVVVLQSRRLEQRIDSVAAALASARTELRTDRHTPPLPTCSARMAATVSASPARLSSR